MARTLNQTVFAGGVVYPAGTAATDELEEKIPNPAHWDGDPSEGGAGYGGQQVPELEAEVERRNADRDADAIIEVTGTGRNGKVLKKDLIAALEADDEAGDEA